MENSRTKNSIFNISSGFIVYFIKIIASFIVRTIFIKTLGEKYLGINGLFTNVLSMLSLAEMGISTAISFSLYKPLEEKDYKKISALMSFYKKTYNIIGLIVFVLGIILYAFLDKFINDYEGLYLNISIIYFMYLINTVSTYYTSYKEILIIADQKNYELTKINIICFIILYILQAIELLIFKNFILYLLIQFVMQIILKLMINKYVTKKYDKVSYNSTEKIDKITMSDIKKNVKAMFFHKIGDYCINSTDNLIISSFIDISTVGLYSNYTTLLNMVTTIVGIFFSNIVSSFGNLLVKNREKSYSIFKEMDFIAFTMYSTIGISVIILINKFIKIWIGEKYLLDDKIIYLIGFNFFFSGMRVVSNIVKTVAGKNNEDKFVPIIQSIINIAVSIILVQNYGLYGVIIGTIVSSIVPNLYRPYIVYNKIFNISIFEYYKLMIKYINTFFIGVILLVLINRFIIINNEFISLIVSAMTLLLYPIVIFCIYKKTNEFKNVCQRIKNIIHKFIKEGEI